jgi:hypothetical protein
MAVTRKSRADTKETPLKKLTPEDSANKSGVRNKWDKFYRKYQALIKTAIIIIYYWIGIAYFGQTEGWDVTTCIYFTTVTCATVGYGDHHPTKNSTRLFNIPYLLFGVLFVFSYCNDFAKAILVGAQDEMIYEISAKLGKQLTYNERKRARIIFSCISVTLVLLCGTLFYAGNEGWPYLDAFYWCICTATTVGYGKCRLPLCVRAVLIFIMFQVIL